jgi:hypothetical protein
MLSSITSSGVLPEAAMATCLSAVALLGDPLGRPDPERLPPRILISFDYFSERSKPANDIRAINLLPS